MEKAMITILAPCGNSSQILITYQTQSHCYSTYSKPCQSWDNKVTLSGYCNNQTFVPNFRQILLSPLTKTLKMPDLEYFYMITFPYHHRPSNFSPYGFLNWE